MNIMKTKQIIATTALLVVMAIGHVSITFALSFDDSNQAPVLPPGCEQLAPLEGNEVAYHVYAVGVQIYRWNGTAWATNSSPISCRASMKATISAGPTSISVASRSPSSRTKA